MNKKQKNKHNFAFYYQSLVDTIGIIELTDKELINRIGSVVRLKVNDAFVLFCKHYVADCTLVGLTHKKITVSVNTVKKTITFKPNITLLLPVLKKESLEKAIYGAVESGVSSIQLITTKKTQRKWGGQKEFRRIEKIIIAAAEQSKHYIVPECFSPIDLETALQKYKAAQLFFADPDGVALGAISKIKNQITILVGPEGDLTSEEKDLLVDFSVTCFKLTPTILRSFQAAIVSVALMRTLF